MKEQFIRSAMLLGDDKIDILSKKRVAVFGVGGVGGAVCEALARIGVGKIDVIDNDTVSLSNINRQIIADHSTVGLKKVDAAEKRIKAINPDCEVIKHDVFFLPENSQLIDFKLYDYVVDAVDTVTAKIHIIVKSKECDVPVISSMGTGNKLDPTQFEITDIYKTSVCPLAKVMRYELKQRGIKKLKVLFSKEIPKRSGATNELGKQIPASVSFVPPVAGFIIASEVIKDLIKEDE